MEITSKKSRSHLFGNYMARKENRKINIEVPESQICQNWTAALHVHLKICWQYATSSQTSRGKGKNYTLQSNRAKYNQHRVNDTYQLCKTGTEDREPFILKCNSLEHVRQKYIQNLQDYLNSIQYGLYERIYRNDLLVHIILDSTSEDISPSVIELKHQHYIDI